MTVKLSFFYYLPIFVAGFTAANGQTEELQFVKFINDNYENYKVKEITTHRINHSDAAALIEKFRLSMDGIITVEEAGVSAENRSISLITMGTGRKKIFFWSQMHGDEPTATMALFDIFSFFNTHRNNSIAKKVLSECTLLFIPMLNPDGAERFRRRNAQGIDINRDAALLRTNEAKILKSVRDRFEPQYGFNLHDQDPHISVGATNKNAAMSLLAPAFNEAREMNEVRLRATKLAAIVHAALKEFIDGHIARYDDTFEPRAFGDNMQKWGTSTVLIESGGWKNDTEKMFLRKLNCIALLRSMEAIADGSIENADVESYANLPMNGKNLYDLIIRNVTLEFPNGIPSILTDLGVNIDDEHSKAGEKNNTALIVERGDLRFTRALEEFDAGGKKMKAEFIKNDVRMPFEELMKIFK